MKLYIFLYICEDQINKSYIEIKKFSFLNFNFENNIDYNKAKIDLNGKPRITSSVIIENYKLLILFFMDFNTNYFCSNIYNYNLENIVEKNYRQFSPKSNSNGLFFKSCYLYDEYIAFIYFINANNFIFEILSLEKNPTIIMIYKVFSFILIKVFY